MEDSNSLTELLLLLHKCVSEGLACPCAQVSAYIEEKYSAVRSANAVAAGIISEIAKLGCCKCLLNLISLRITVCITNGCSYAIPYFIAKDRNHTEFAHIYEHFIARRDYFMERDMSIETEGIWNFSERDVRLYNARILACNEIVKEFLIEQLENPEYIFSEFTYDEICDFPFILTHVFSYYSLI